MQNHVIDPSFFYDCIEEFSFNYTIYVNNKIKVDDYGRQVNSYEKNTIRGSLQSTGSNLMQSKSGNKYLKGYNFYCKSLYRIDENDIIQYKNQFYIVKSVQDYDEYGVRSASLEIIDLAKYNDLLNYIKYLNGEEIV